MTAVAQGVRGAPSRRPVVRRLLSAVLVFRLELRPLAPLDVASVLLAWLRRPAIEMPMRQARATESGAEHVWTFLDRVAIEPGGAEPPNGSANLTSVARRIDEMYPF